MVLAVVFSINNREGVMAAQNDNNQGDGGGGDGRGQVTDPATDQRVGNKSGNMGRTFKENPELAAEAGRKGGEHSHGGGGGNRGAGAGGGGGGGNRGEGGDNRGGGGNRGGPMSQKEGVFQAIVNVRGGDDQFDGPINLSGEERAMVRERLVEQFKNGEISLGTDMGGDDKRLATYCSGLISNWVRKDSRLNGGGKYQPKNPGSRAGNGDEALRAMKTLLTITPDPEAKKAIQAEIAKRQDELRPKREINLDALPENLRKYVPQQS